MKKFSFDSPFDVLALVFRRRWWAACCFVLLSSAVVTVAWMLPPLYVSETLILIEPRDVPEDFVKDLVSVSTEDRLSSIQETVLSRTNLLRILNEFSADLPNLRGLDDDARVNRIRKRIKIDVQTRRDRNRSPLYFRVAFENESPALAQKVAGRLAALFIEHDSRTREQQVFGTTQFMSGELDKVSMQLNEAASQLRVIKERYRNELPEHLDTNLRSLDRFHEQLKANTEALDRYVTMRLSLELQLTDTPAQISKTLPPLVSPSRPLQTRSPLVEQYRQKEMAYKELRNRYTERHPDVLSLKSELDRLQAEIPPEDFQQIQQEEAAGPTVITEPNPVYQRLTAQLEEVKTEIAIRDRERTWIQEQINKLNWRIQNTPQREQEIASLLREHDELQKQYEDLKGKLSQARLAESLESKQKGAQFVILDPAGFPMRPSKPNRLMILLLGIAGSLGMGLAVAVGVDFMDQKVWTQAELEKFMGMPVLVEIPEIASSRQLRHEQKKKRRQRILAAAGVAIVLALLAVVFLTPAIRQPLGAEVRHLVNRIGDVIVR
jgi:polysaccharide biosynthesis transport protein